MSNIQKEQMKNIPCPVLRLDGTKSVDKLLEEIKETGNIMDNNFENILSLFGICKPLEIKQIL